MSKTTYTSWTHESIIEQIRAESIDGVAPSTRDEDGNATLLSRAARRCWGSWEAACEIAGVRPRSTEREWTKERVLEELKALSVDGIAPSSGDDTSLTDAARRLFGSWEEACWQADVRPRSQPQETCYNCLGPIDPSSRRVFYCSEACQKEGEHDWRFNAYALDRLRDEDSPSEFIRRRRVWERDRGICQWCRDEVDPSLAYPHPLSGTIDHTLALSNGGHHTMSNVSLMHSACNHEKHVTMDRQYAAA